MVVVSRSLLDHPAVGTTGGAGLHTSVETIYRKLGDNATSRYFTVDALADAASQDFEHNFKDAFSELTVLLYLHNTGSGELTRITGATSPAIGDFGIIATPGDETTQVRVTNNSGAPRDLAVIVLQNGGASAGGGGGGSLNWDEPPGQAPLKTVENNQIVFLYEADGSNRLVSFIKVPQGHSPGTQLKMRLSHYSPSTSNNVLLKTVSYLIRSNTDAISSTTNSHVSTNTAITNSGVANKLVETIADITDSSGQINSITVQPGDMIRVELFRDIDTDTADIRFIPNGTEVE